MYDNPKEPKTYRPVSTNVAAAVISFAFACLATYCYAVDNKDAALGGLVCILAPWALLWEGNK